MVGGRYISRYMYSCIDFVHARTHARSFASRDAKRQRQQLGSSQAQMGGIRIREERKQLVNLRELTREATRLLRVLIFDSMLV